jgi:hypothetical protein
MLAYIWRGALFKEELACFGKGEGVEEGNQTQKKGRINGGLAVPD